MKLLEAEPTQAPPAPGAPGGTPAGAGEAPARACAACGAGMAADQDWCLSCGTAAPGRLGQRPGWRAAVTVLALTLVLVAGSVAAAYAALTSDATQEAAAPPPPDVSPVAQAAPATPPSSATPPAPKLPKVPAPASTPAPTTPATPVTSTPAPQAAVPATPPSSSASSGAGSGRTGGGQGTVTLPAPVAIALPADAGALYDPSRLVTPPPDPALARRALDGKPSTAFTITPGRPEWGVGYVVDLQKPHGLRTLEITTSTPGFRVEVYATDLATPPPTVTDARWAHLADRKAVGGDGKPQTLRLDDGSTTYRTLLVWITKGPARGGRVALDELTVTR